MEVKLGSYRKDIDGLRAIAVLSVIVFHMGFLPNGYLGVDIFFVISGYLITKIVYGEASDNRFSIVNFYLRRIRRIIPLVLFTTFIALVVGLFVMLPDDLENLCQSVFATNVFANNILLMITTGDYWALSNEYKPLMHTWSLGVEEQFYVIYPIIFLLLNGKRSRWILPLLVILTIASLALYCYSIHEVSLITDEKESARAAGKAFYSIQYRFFELSIGGLGAILFGNKRVNGNYAVFLTLFILAIMLFDFGLPAHIRLLLTVFASVGLLISGDNKSKLSAWMLENPVMTWLGKISFSLYMWHQIVLAYTRYTFTQEIGIVEAIVIFVVILLLSIGSYFLIEQPFRDKKRVQTKTLLAVSAGFFAVICATSIYFYSLGGIVRAVPELEIAQSDVDFTFGSGKRDIQNAHISYNDKNYALDRPFNDVDNIKVLFIGNSFARDFINVVLESKYGKKVDISYTFDINTGKNMNERLAQADFILFSRLQMKELDEYRKHFNIDTTKVWNIGGKNFGPNNGLFYKKNRSGDYCKQRTFMNDGSVEFNDSLKKQWRGKYIDLMGPITDKEGRIPVFSNECKFISQDGSHLTHGGAVYFSQVLDLDRIFNNKQSK